MIQATAHSPHARFHCPTFLLLIFMNERPFEGPDRKKEGVWFARSPSSSWKRQTHHHRGKFKGRVFLTCMHTKKKRTKRALLQRQSLARSGKRRGPLPLPRSLPPQTLQSLPGAPCVVFKGRKKEGVSTAVISH